MANSPESSASKKVLGIIPLGFRWQTLDPFLFCVHHDDRYPSGNEVMGPDASLAGRNLGMDFDEDAEWRMYHGREVPGFPRHPHRGFETITIARHGFIDHSDSLGATARFGQGDVQWMTAGKGVEHSEMFPLIDREGPNRTELFQIWLNLPRAGKMVEPHFTMFWADQIPSKTFEDAEGRVTTLSVVAGPLEGVTPLAPPPDSWASKPDSAISIWTMKMEAGAVWTAPPATGKDVHRVFYFFEGNELTADGASVPVGHAFQVDPGEPLTIENGESEAELLMLQGSPIGEPVVNHGPFVMNTVGEIKATMLEYQRNGFGDWKWTSSAPVHSRDSGRFAIHADGRREDPS